MNFHFDECHPQWKIPDETSVNEFGDSELLAIRSPVSWSESLQHVYPQ